MTDLLTDAVVARKGDIVVMVLPVDLANEVQAAIWDKGYDLRGCSHPDPTEEQRRHARGERLGALAGDLHRALE